LYVLFARGCAKPRFCIPKLLFYYLAIGESLLKTAKAVLFLHLGLGKGKRLKPPFLKGVAARRGDLEKREYLGAGFKNGSIGGGI